MLKVAENAIDCIYFELTCIGKDEVGSSNLPSSSKNTGFRKKLGVFHNFFGVFDFARFSRIEQRIEAAQKLSSAQKSGAGIVPCTALFLCRILLGFLHRVPGRLTGAADVFFIGVGVHPQRDRRVAMSEAFRNADNIRAGREGNTCGAMPLWYNNDKPEESRIFKGFQGFQPDF